MSKTVILTDLVIIRMDINYEAQFVKVTYNLIEASGQVWNTGIGIFWVTIPPEPTDQDFQLPDGYISILVQLRTDADQALTDRFLV